MAPSSDPPNGRVRTPSRPPPIWKRARASSLHGLLLLLLLLDVGASLTAPGKLILLRHGQSLWNLENRFTGWEDVPLTALGEEEAREAAALLVTEEPSMKIDVVYSSVLSRCIRTAEIFNEEYSKLHGVSPVSAPRPLASLCPERTPLSATP